MAIKSAICPTFISWYFSKNKCSKKRGFTISPTLNDLFTPTVYFLLLHYAANVEKENRTLAGKSQTNVLKVLAKNIC